MPSLDHTFSALADPTRRAILARLAKGEASVLELAKPFAMSQPAISKHLKVLERAGLIPADVMPSVECAGSRRHDCSTLINGSSGSAHSGKRDSLHWTMFSRI